MANENKGITLAQIRSGAKEFVLDNSTVSDDIRSVQVALRVLGYWGSGRIIRILFCCCYSRVSKREWYFRHRENEQSDPYSY